MSTRDFRRTFRATVLNPVSPVRCEAYQPGFLTINQGKIQSLSTEPAEAEIIDLDDCIIIPGLVDTHVHLPQFGILGLGSNGLLEWLKQFTYPEEARFADARYAQAIAQEFFDELVANGTTTASIFSSIHEEATDIVAFLKTLSGKFPEQTMPRLPETPGMSLIEE